MARPPRIPGRSYRGDGAYFLTWCTYERERVLVSPPVIADVQRHIHAAAQRYHVEVVAYCYMPDHVHLLVAAPQADSDVQAFVRLAKQRSAFAWRRSMGTTLWQPGYYDRALRESESMLEVIAYLVANPLRAGLATRVEDYPFWGVTGYSVTDVCEAIVGTKIVRRG